jgi:hypothetical protein
MGELKVRKKGKAEMEDSFYSDEVIEIRFDNLDNAVSIHCEDTVWIASDEFVDVLKRELEPNMKPVDYGPELHLPVVAAYKDIVEKHAPIDYDFD